MSVPVGKRGETKLAVIDKAEKLAINIHREGMRIYFLPK